MGGKSQTTNSTSSQTYTPRGLEQLQQILQQAFNVSKTPYQPYKGQLVAGFNPEMFKGIQGINRAATAANPYLQQASQYAQQGAAPISSSQISNYENPFQSDVINSTMANINQTNAQQQNQVVGNAALQGALGGDRVKVAQAALAGQQNMSNNQTLAGLNSQNYSQALGAAQQDRSAAGQAAYTFGNLGQEAQNTALQGAGAQLQSGQLEQQEQQNKLTSAYQQFLKQQAFPYQQLQFLAGIGLPTIGAMGGTTEGTSSTTTPGPSPWGQIAGLGLTAAGMFLRDGGRVSPKKYADGGITGGPADYIDITSYVPKPIQLSAGQQHIPGVSYPKAPQQQSMGMPSASQISGGIGGLKSIFGSMGNASAGPSYGGPIDASTWGGSSDNDIGFSHGGFVNSVHAIRKALRGHRYASGGVADDVRPGISTTGTDGDPRFDQAVDEYRRGKIAPLSQQIYSSGDLGPLNINPFSIKMDKDRRYDDGGSVPAFDERFVGIVPDKYDIGPSQVLATADPTIAPIDNSYIANGTPMAGTPVSGGNIADVAGPAGYTVLPKGDRLETVLPEKIQDRVPQATIADIAGPAGVGPLPVSAGFDGTDNVPLPPARPITGTEAIPGAVSTDYTAPTAGYSDNIDRYGKAIGSIESGNSYGALGPVIPKTGDRAYGKYQVMGENVPAWTKEVLGKSLTPEQFLKSPEAQDAVFRAKFGQYVNKYGPEGASRAWFAGEGGMNNLAARDVLGTTVGDYGKQFASALGGDSSTPFNSDALIPRSAQTVQYSPQQNGSSPNGAPQADRGLIGKITDAFGGKSWDQLLFGHSLTPEQRNSLMAAGAGMMASPSHFPLQQIGEGSLQGLNYYQKAQATNQAQQRINLEAQNMARQAQQFAQDFGLKQQNFGLEQQKFGVQQTLAQKQLDAQQIQALAPVKIGQNAMGQDIFAVRDPKTGQYKPINPQTGSAEAGQPSALAPVGGADNGLGHGDAYLAKIDPTMAQQVKALSEGRMAFPSGFALKSPYWQNMLRMVSQYDPSFDAINYNARSKTRNDFTAGKSAQNLTAFNTAIQHLDTLDKSIAPLNNSSYPTWNKWANAISSETGNTTFQVAKKNFDTAKTAVSDELTRAFRGAGGNVHDIMEWEKSINSAESPQALHAAVKQAIDLLRGRVEAVGDQYNRGMGTTKDPLELLSPKAQTAIKRMTGEETSSTNIDARDIQALKANASNPAAKAAIDKKYGAGMADRLLAQ
jgi:hypothetical protein